MMTKVHLSPNKSRVRAMGQDDRNARAGWFVSLAPGAIAVWSSFLSFFSFFSSLLPSILAAPGAEPNRRRNDQGISGHREGCGVVNALQAKAHRVRQKNGAKAGQQDS